MTTSKLFRNAAIVLALSTTSMTAGATTYGEDNTATADADATILAEGDTNTNTATGGTGIGEGGNATGGTGIGEGGNATGGTGIAEGGNATGGNAAGGTGTGGSVDGVESTSTSASDSQSTSGVGDVTTGGNTLAGGSQSTVIEGDTSSYYSKIVQAAYAPSLNVAPIIPDGLACRIEGSWSFSLGGVTNDDSASGGFGRANKWPDGLPWKNDYTTDLARLAYSKIAAIAEYRQAIELQEALTGEPIPAETLDQLARLEVYTQNLQEEMNDASRSFNKKQNAALDCHLSNYFNAWKTSIIEVEIGVDSEGMITEQDVQLEQMRWDAASSAYKDNGDSGALAVQYMADAMVNPTTAQAIVALSCANKDQTKPDDHIPGLESYGPEDQDALYHVWDHLVSQEICNTTKEKRSNVFANAFGVVDDNSGETGETPPAAGTRATGRAPAPAQP